MQKSNPPDMHLVHKWKFQGFVVSLKHKLSLHSIMLPLFQSLNHCIKLLVISAPFWRASLGFYEKNATGLFSWDKTTPSPAPLVSHLTLNILSKLRRARTGAVSNFSLIRAKCQTFNNGCSNSTEISNKPCVKCCKVMETPNITSCLLCRPISNGSHLIFIHVNTYALTT